MDYLERQKMLFTEEEALKLKQAVVYIGGAGGLGTHQALELQRVGIKKIYLVDYDKVELSNLNRQILYGMDSIGEYKVDQAKKTLESFNLPTIIETKVEKISKKSKIPKDVNVILDALDNFETRYILEQLAWESKIPYIHAGVNQWYGQLTTIIPGRTLSLKDIFGEVDTTQEKVSVVSPVVSIMASLQVIEAIKVITGRKNTLDNKLLLIDLKDYSFEIINLQ
ncbi:MAG: molybdopterin-synthase adenylyltransferase [Petrotoga sp.]|nr:molybdopterin-synthase adenylyltransferase [Petrotoga sp.]